MTENIKHINVRHVKMSLNVSNRSLELCSRMNYEIENLDFIDNCIKGDVIYDIGACEGRFAIYAAHKGLIVHAFEPENANFQMLLNNLKINDGIIVKTHNVGVSDKNSKVVMNIGQPWAGGHQKVVDHGEKRQDLDFDFTDKQEIEVVRLDDYVNSNNLPKPNWIKVDIDGSELPFLRGAVDIIGDVSLKGIIFELNKKDSNYLEIIGVLETAGWKPTQEYAIPNEPNLFNIIFSK